MSETMTPALFAELKRYREACGGHSPEEFTLKDRGRTNEHNLLVKENRELRDNLQQTIALLKRLVDRNSSYIVADITADAGKLLLKMGVR